MKASLAVKASLAALCAAASALAAGPAAAQDKYPSRPIEIIVPYASGNDTDSFFRVLAQGMSKRLGVPVQVINKPGGGGVVGTAEFVRAKPDGYTLASWTPGPGITQIVAGNAPYKQSDLQPVAGLFVNNFVLAVRKDIPANNLKEFGDWAKKSGKPVVVGSFVASLPALITARIAKQDGWSHKVVAFQNPSAKELIAGDADVTTTGAEMVAPFTKTGQVKVLSAWAPGRSKAHPEVATLKEAGYPEMYIWTGLAAPAGTPKEIVERLAAVAKETLGDAETGAVIAKLGTPMNYMTPQQMGDRIAADTKWIGELMPELGLVKK